MKAIINGYILHGSFSMLTIFLIKSAKIKKGRRTGTTEFSHIEMAVLVPAPVTSGNVTMAAAKTTAATIIKFLPVNIAFIIQYYMHLLNTLEQPAEESPAFVVIAENKINGKNKYQKPYSVIIIIAAWIATRITRPAGVTWSAWIAARIIISHKKTSIAFFSYYEGNLLFVSCP